MSRKGIQGDTGQIIEEFRQYLAKHGKKLTVRKAKGFIVYIPHRSEHARTDRDN